MKKNKKQVTRKKPVTQQPKKTVNTVKHTSKEKSETVKQSPKIISSVSAKRKTVKQYKPATLSKKEKKSRYIIFGIITMLAITLYVNTLPYDYVLDDKAVITNNQFTKKGLKGISEVLVGDIFEGIKAKGNYVAGGRYRPLSLVLFAIEWEFFADGAQLTPESIAQLKNANIPQPVILKLDSLKNQKFDTKEEFKEKLVSTIGKQATDQYLPAIQKTTLKTGGTQTINHIVNIILYALTGIMIFVILSKLFSNYKPIGGYWFLSIPFLTTMLYMAHPLHTEAIANIKGRDEIMTFLGALITLWYSLKYIEEKHFKYIIYSFIAFFLALLSKENAVTFVAVIPLTVYIFYPSRRNKTKEEETNIRFYRKPATELKNYIIIVVPLLISTIVFMILRVKIVGSLSSEPSKDLMNNPFIYMTFGEKYATIFYTLGLYIKLLFFPHPLTFDYYPFQIKVLNWGDVRALIPLLIYFVMGIYAFIRLKKKSIVSYGIFFYLFTFSIVSNVFFPIGAFLSERFMYISSLGFCLILVYLLAEKLPVYIKDNKKLVIAVASITSILMVLYSVKTIIRNPVWESEYTLFTTDVHTSPMGAKANYAAGFAYVQKAKTEEDMAKRSELYETGISYLEKAVDIHPKYENVLVFLANTVYEYNKDYKLSLEYYKRVLAMYPNYNKVYNYIFWILGNNAKPISPDEKIIILKDVQKYNPQRYDVNFNLGLLYFKNKGDHRKAIPYLEAAIKTGTQSSDPYKVLGVCYGKDGKLKPSIEMFEKAMKLNPKDKQVYKNIGLVYKTMGNQAKAEEYFRMAQTK